MYSSLSDEMARGWDCFNNAMVRLGGEGGAHSIEMGEGTLHLKMVG